MLWFLFIFTGIGKNPRRPLARSCLCKLLRTCRSRSYWFTSWWCLEGRALRGTRFHSRRLWRCWHRLRRARGLAPCVFQITRLPFHSRPRDGRWSRLGNWFRRSLCSPLWRKFRLCHYFHVEFWPAAMSALRRFQYQQALLTRPLFARGALCKRPPQFSTGAATRREFREWPVVGVLALRLPVFGIRALGHGIGAVRPHCNIGHTP